MYSEVTREDCHTYWGKSSDTKPTKNVGNGSMFYEMDTGKLYLFDFENKKWLEQPTNSYR